MSDQTQPVLDLKSAYEAFQVLAAAYEQRIREAQPALNALMQHATESAAAVGRILGETIVPVVRAAQDARREDWDLQS